MKRALIAVLAFFVVGSALGQSPELAKIRITTWNLEWFPNGLFMRRRRKQVQRIEAAADVLKKLDPDILLLQEMRDYDACARLGQAIHPGAYQVAICSAFKGAKQQEAINAKIPAQAPWSESWKINGRNRFSTRIRFCLVQDRQCGYRHLLDAPPYNDPQKADPMLGG